jgi:hypothetical protein
MFGKLLFQEFLRRPGKLKGDGTAGNSYNEKVVGSSVDTVPIIAKPQTIHWGLPGTNIFLARVIGVVDPPKIRMNRFEGAVRHADSGGNILL